MSLESLSAIEKRLPITSRSSALALLCPVCEARPRNQKTVSSISASQASNSSSSRVFPTPASPTTVTTCQPRSSKTSQVRSWRKRSSISRPTVVVSTPSTPVDGSSWKS